MVRRALGRALYAPSQIFTRRLHDAAAAAAAAEQPLVPAIVRTITELSPSTRGLTLEVSGDDQFAFQPGMWVDMHIPGIDQIGGYSITSLPSALPLVDLAVKAADYPPAAWVTRECEVGSQVQLRAGGTFTLPTPRQRHNLFIAGGVGINPLYAMLAQLASEAASGAWSEGRAALLYSAGTRDELIFAEELQALVSAHPERIHLELRTTREEVRIGPVEVYAALKWLRRGENTEMDSDSRSSSLDVFCCGPPGLPEAMVAACSACGVREDAVRYEQWW